MGIRNRLRKRYANLRVAQAESILSNTDAAGLTSEILFNDILNDLAARLSPTSVDFEDAHNRIELLKKQRAEQIAKKIYEKPSPNYFSLMEITNLETAVPESKFGTKYLRRIRFLFERELCNCETYYETVRHAISMGWRGVTDDEREVYSSGKLEKELKQISAKKAELHKKSEYLMADAGRSAIGVGALWAMK
jgi:hypothetical protein